MLNSEASAAGLDSRVNILPSAVASVVTRVERVAPTSGADYGGAERDPTSNGQSTREASGSARSEKTPPGRTAVDDGTATFPAGTEPVAVEQYDALRAREEQSRRIAESVERFEKSVERVRYFSRPEDLSDPPDPTEIQQRMLDATKGNPPSDEAKEASGEEPTSTKNEEATLDVIV